MAYEAEAALFSLYDRTGAVDLARALVARGMPIYATGGTRAHLRERRLDLRVRCSGAVARGVALRAGRALGRDGLVDLLSAPSKG